MYKIILFLLIIYLQFSISSEEAVRVNRNYNNNLYSENNRFKVIFPIKGIQQKFTGKTKHTAPRTPGDYVIAKQSDWYYEWPTPKPEYSYSVYKDKNKVKNNQEPGFYACRPTLEMPNGCGRPHQGIDIYAHYGTPIVAPENGYISSYSGEGVYSKIGTENKNGGSGRLITLEGDSGNTYIFMHTMGLSENIANLINIRKDFDDTKKQSLWVRVTSGEVIGYVGCTGGIINPHLHFEIIINGMIVDPNDLL